MLMRLAAPLPGPNSTNSSTSEPATALHRTLASLGTRASLTAALCFSLFGNTAVADGPECGGMLVCSSSDIPGLFSDPDDFGDGEGGDWMMGPDLWDILLGVDDTDGPGDTDDTDDTDDVEEDPDAPDTGTCDPDEEDDSSPDDYCPIIPSEDMVSTFPLMDTIWDTIARGAGGAPDDDGSDTGGGGSDTDGGGGGSDTDGGGSDTDGGGPDTGWGGGNGSPDTDDGGDTDGGADTHITGETGVNDGPWNGGPPTAGEAGASPSAQSRYVHPDDRGRVKSRMQAATPGMQFSLDMGGREYSFLIDQVASVEVAGQTTDQVVFHSLAEFGPVFTLVNTTDRLYLVHYTVPRHELDWNDVMKWWHAQQAE